MYALHFCHSLILKLALKSCVPIGNEECQLHLYICCLFHFSNANNSSPCFQILEDCWDEEQRWTSVKRLVGFLCCLNFCLFLTFNDLASLSLDTCCSFHLIFFFSSYKLSTFWSSTWCLDIVVNLTLWFHTDILICWPSHSSS